MFSFTLTQNNTYLLALCLSVFLMGWDDGTAGPLIIRMQESYNVGYTIVSLIFVCKCAAATAGATLQLIAFAIQSPRPPFPVLAIAYYIDGFGSSIQGAQANALIPLFPTGQHAKMMIVHGMYGVGALISPFIATQFAQMEHWAFMYLASLGVAAVTVFVLLAVFRLRSQASILEDLGAGTKNDGIQTEGILRSQSGKEKELQGWDKYYAIMRMPVVHLAALFIFTYAGVEVSLGSWSVTYLVKEKGGGPRTGYVSSGYFGGLTIGRFSLIWLNQFLGERRAIFYYTSACIGLQISVWFAKSLMVLVLARFVPPSFMGGVVGWIACLAATGSAVFPFIVGAMSSKFGIWVQQPLLSTTLNHSKPCLI
ncbi:MFS general substrate transporter, partial [Clavulina sp. PMI_390]